MCNSLVLKDLHIRVFYMYKPHILNALDGVDNFFSKIFGNLKYFSYIVYVNVINDKGFYSLFYYTHIYRKLYIFLLTQNNGWFPKQPNFMNNEQFSNDEMWKTIEHYETYFNGKRSQRQKYIMGRAIKRFVTFNHLENPNMYLLYLIADKSLNRIKSKSENGRVYELEEELQKDIHLFIK